MPSGGKREGAGRKPNTNKVKPVTVYLRDEELKKIDDRAMKDGMSRQEYLRSRIQETTE